MSSNWGHESWGIIACLDPDAYTATEYNTYATESDTIDMSKWSEIMVILLAGTLGSSATLDLDVETGSVNGTFGTTLKSITQLTQAGTDSDKQVIVSVKAEELAAGHRYVNIEVTLGTATSDFGLLVLGKAKYAPATDDDLSTVDEVVA